MNRNSMLKLVSEAILSIQSTHPIRVGIDGVDGSGKTYLADELAKYLTTSRQIIRTSIDGFHNSKAIRYQRGRESPEGYYRDSFNYASLIDVLLAPLGPNGSLEYQRSVFDYKKDSDANITVQKADRDSILIMDGVFLFRPELLNYWEVKIFVDVDFAVSVSRAVERDIKNAKGLSAEELTKMYKVRYVGGQELYLTEAKPKEVADIVINNTRFDSPVLALNSSSVFTSVLPSAVNPDLTKRDVSNPAQEAPR